MVNVHDILFSGALDDHFPLPPTRPFTTAMAIDAGVNHRSLQQLVAGGVLRRPVKGVYLATEVGDSLALRVEALKLVAPRDAVIVDRHAGWLHGAQMILAPGEHLSLAPLSIFRTSGNGRIRNDISRSGERWLRDEDIIEIDGLRVTTPIRTAWDLGRVRWPERAIAAIDAMHRLGAYEPAEFLDGIKAFKGFRWVTTLRAVGPLADGRSESPPESIIRWRARNAGVLLTPQVDIYRGDEFLGRADLADKELKTVVEYDGVEWHSEPDQQKHDRERRAEFRSEDWLVEVFTKDSVFNRDTDVERRVWNQRVRARARRGNQIAGLAAKM